ncbi:hypothetical protein GN958_ATG02710 [Phytophthora infestans]|uniref:Uncharacterized protein n=1 Tax=Phytophthora infestans TaxID=4787 RepID=A0A8S9V9Q7_PHYIN|nr:hypothetical protein GN958_ATG02710 [Phytophthora infestans]
MRELANSKSHKQQAWKEKATFEKMCDVEELQVRNQQLPELIRELSEMNEAKVGPVGDAESMTSSAPLIITGDSDEERNRIGASNVIKKGLAMARKEIRELRMEREQERDMTTAIVKQRDMYPMLLAQSDTKCLNDSAPSRTTGAQVNAALVESVAACSAR